MALPVAVQSTRRALVALAIFAGLAVLHTWPLASAPWRLAFDNADAGHSAWTLAWIDHALVRDPGHVFDTNTFWPERQTLTYADPMFVPALAAAPVRMLGGSAVFAANVDVLVGLTLTAWCTWFVAARWTGSASAGLVAGALAAFNPHTLTRLPQAVAPYLWTLPLLLFVGDRLVDRPSRRDAIAMALLVALTAATSIYWLALAGIIVGTTMVVGAVTKRWAGATRVAIASIAGIVIAAPVLWPYARVAAAGTTRPLETVMQFSATPAGYLASLSHLHRGWSAAFFRDDLDVFFAGATAIVLAIAGFAAGRRLPRTSRRLGLLVVIAAAGVLLSFGPATSVYRWLYDWLPPLRGLRVAARFGYLYLLAVAMAAAYGALWLVSRWPRRATAIVCAALALVTIEAWHGPVAMHAYTGVPPIYDIVRDLPAPVRLVEVPFYPPDAMHENAEYIVNSTVHWRSLMNGYSGFTPDSYRERTGSFWFFPEPWAVDAIRASDATHVMVHLERFGNETADVKRTLMTIPGLELIASDGDHRLYRVRRP